MTLNKFVNLNPSYTSSSSYSKKQTIPISLEDDPRLTSIDSPFKISRQNAEISIIGQSKTFANLLLNLKGAQFTFEDPSTQVGGTAPEAIIPSLQGARSYTAPTNLAASWNNADLVVTWDYDFATGDNSTVTLFEVTIYQTGNLAPYIFVTDANTLISNQSLTITLGDLKTRLGINVTNLSTIEVLARDVYSNRSPKISISAPTYNSGLTAPTISEIHNITNGYSVTVSNVSSQPPTFNSISIEEYISNSSTEPTGVTYTQVALGKINPVTIFTATTEKRWVKARFTDEAGNFGPYSIAYAATPQSVVPIDSTPPNEATSVSAAWSGDDIIVSYTPASDATRIIVTLTAPDSAEGYFYFFTSGSSPQTSKITKASIFGQFGKYYSSYTGVLQSADAADNRSSGVSFNVPVRTNPLSGQTPTFDVLAIANGYIVTWTNIAGATYADVYENSVSWGGSNPTDESLRVYSGQSPATIQSLTYTTKYIKIRFYDDYGNTSNYSAEKTVTPYDPGVISLINNPVTFQTNGSIYAGTYNPTNPADPSGSSAHAIFNKTGIYVYDNTGKPTTQIIGDATTIYDPTKSDGTKITSGTTSTVNFITKNAWIADWIISPSKIENTLYGDSNANTYTGLSGTGTYSFWAGSTTAGGDSNAKFWVKPDGSVQARNISIVGGPSGGNVLNIGGGTFTVTSAGAVTATSADITGAISASSGSITGNFQVSTGTFYAGTLTGARVAISSNGLSAINSSGIQTTSINSFSALASTAIVTSASWNGSAITYNATNSFANGQTVVVSGSGNPNYDRSGTVTNVTNSSFTFSGISSNPGTLSQVTVTAAAWNGSAIVYTATNSFSNGQSVTVSGASNTQYNRSGAVSNVNGSSFTFTGVSSNPGTFSGTATATGSGTITASGQSAPTFTTSDATIGGFTIDSSNIKNSAGTLQLTSTASAGDRFIIKDAANTYQLGMAIPSTGSSNVLYAGPIGSPNFYVTAQGKLTAIDAVLSGTFSLGGSGTINGTTASTVVSGASSGSSAVQPGNGVSLNASKQITTIDTSTGLTIQSSSGFPRVIINSSGIIGYNAGGGQIFNLTNGSLALSGQITSTSGSIAGFNISSTSLQSPTSNLFLYSSVSAGGLDIATANAIETPTVRTNNIGAVSGNTVVDVFSNLKNSGVPSVTGTNNVILSASNIFQKNTASSRRFKRDIIDLNNVEYLKSELLLEIPVRAFKYNNDYISNTDSRYDKIVPGLIAEEVDAVYPIAVEHEEDGQAYVWNPNYIIPGMLDLIQKQHKTIQDLKTRINILENK